MLSRLRAAWSHRDGARANSQWLTHTVADLRKLGFFAGEGELSDAELAAQIASDQLSDTGEPFTGSSPADEVLVAAHDPSRIWWNTCPAKPGKDAWIMALRGWAEISGGSFDPSFTVEQWQSPRGPLTVSFLQGSQHCTVHPSLAQEHIDLSVLAAVNESISGSGRSFVVCPVAGPRRALVLSVTPAEYLALTRRGWPLTIP